jgi:hypothetical protein
MQGNLPPLPAQASRQIYCSAPEYRQFDFWVGEWDAFHVGSATLVARVHVEGILDGYVLREDYQDATGHKGQSFSVYDESRNMWHQSGMARWCSAEWITPNHGELS